MRVIRDLSALTLGYNHFAILSLAYQIRFFISTVPYTALRLESVKACGARPTACGNFLLDISEMLHLEGGENLE